MLPRMAQSPDSELAAALASGLGPWFDREQRDLTWRRTRDPYAIWVSEIMLQQTRVDTVERYYSAFLARFPSVQALAAADESAVLEAWSGLGYYRRARLLHRGARYVAEELGGQVPDDGPGLRKIPGVGRYTAGAIGSIAFDRPQPLVDGNVARVLSRVRALEDPKQQDAGAAAHWTLVEAVLRAGRPRVLAQALMELGATVCVPKNPRCPSCPIRPHCRAHAIEATDRIPAPKKKIAQPVERLGALAVISRRRLMLVRRPGQGLLAGMWCLPLVPVSAPSEPAAGEVFAKPESLAPWTEAGAVRHVFTHRIWELMVLRTEASRRPALVADYPLDTAWVAPGERPEGGMPSVSNKLLAQLEF